MSDMWVGWCAPACRRELARALREVSPFAVLSFADSAEALRRQVLDSEPLELGVIVGLSDSGVSDMNLAAAVAHDGLAESVVLVTRRASGSLRSRAARAGIGMVVDLSALESAATAGAFRKSAGGARAGSPAVDVADGGRGSGAARQVPRGGHAGDAPGVRDGDESRVAAAVPRDTGQARSYDELAGTTRLDRSRLRARDAGTGGTAPGGGASGADDAGAAGANGGSAPVMVFVSGRGGVGKTALAATCAATAGLWGMRVAVLDLDLSCGNLYGCFGVSRPADLARIAQGTPTRELMGRSCARLTENVSLWGPCEQPEMAELVMPLTGTLITYLQSRFDLVLVDSSTTFTDGVAEALQHADRVLVVEDDTPGTLGSVGRATALAVRLGVARTRLVRVRNFANPREKDEAPSGLEGGLLEGMTVFRVTDGGMDVPEMLALGHAPALAQDGGPFPASVRLMLAQILSELGALPNSDEARKAAGQTGKRRKSRFFSRKREVA